VEWVPFQWHAVQGPRDLEFSRASVAHDRGMVSITVRRERATALAQDSTIAPESNPWTMASVRIDCVGRKWQQLSYTAADAAGKVVGQGNSSDAIWLPIHQRTLAEALQQRFCPST
jgi:hypothetical protein